MSTADARSTDPFVSTRPGELDGGQRALYDHILSGSRAGSPVSLTDEEGRLGGPFGLMLLAPELGHPLQGLGAAIRFESSLSAMEREAIILAIAVARRSEYEWYVHERVCRSLGVNESSLEAIANANDDALPEGLRPYLRIARAVATCAGVAADERARLGDATLFAVLVTAGYYTLLANLLEAFDVGLPQGVPTRFDPR